MDKYVGRILVGVLAAVLGGLAVHTPATIWIGTMLGDNMDVIIKAWKEVLLLALTPFVLWAIWRDKGLLERIKSDKLLWLVSAYILLHLIMLMANWQGLWPSIAGLIIDLRYIFAFVLVHVAVMAYPQARRWLLGAILAGAIIVVGFATVQHALPHDALKHIGYGPDTVVPYLTVDQNYDYIRLSSTMRGPNPMGAYVASVILVLIGLAWARKLVGRKVRLAALVLGVLSMAALWFSYSRSAQLGFLAGLATLAVVLRPWLRFSSKMLVSASILVSVTAMIMMAVLWQSSWFSNVVLHTNTEGGSSTQSNAEHWRSLVDGTERMVAQPLGVGVGSTGSASLFGDRPLIIENQYLFIAHEVGWLGVILFVAIFVLIMLKLYRVVGHDSLASGVFASGVGLAVVGMVLPVWVDDVVSIVWWSLAAIVLASGSRYTVGHGRSKVSTRHKKTARAA